MLPPSLPIIWGLQHKSEHASGQKSTYVDMDRWGIDQSTVPSKHCMRLSHNYVLVVTIDMQKLYVKVFRFMKLTHFIRKTYWGQATQCPSESRSCGRNLERGGHRKYNALKGQNQQDQHWTERVRHVSVVWHQVSLWPQSSAEVQMIREGFRESVEELGGCCQSQAVEKGSMKMHF